MRKRIVFFAILIMLVLTSAACAEPSAKGMPVSSGLNEDAGQRVLVITEDTEFKAVLVNETQNQLNEQGLFTEIECVNNPSRADDSGYDVVAVVWHIQMGKLPANVENYINRCKEQDKLIIFATSGGGEMESDCAVDAVTCPSQNDPTEQADALTGMILEKLNIN